MKAASSPMFIRWELLYDGFVIDFISICETIHASTVAFFILFFPFYNLNLKLQNCNTEAYLKKGSKNFGRKIATKIQRFPWFCPMLGSRYGYGEYVSYGLRGNGLGNSF